MKTWNDYKEHVRTVDPEIGKDIDEVENISSIVSAMVEQRTSLGLSQRELAAMCGIPQSSVARIESCKTTPNNHQNRAHLIAGVLFFFALLSVIIKI